MFPRKDLFIDHQIRYDAIFSWTSVNKANAIENPLAALPSFQVYNRNDVNLVIEAKRVTDLDTETQEWIVDLMERNMKEMYEKVGEELDGLHMGQAKNALVEAEVDGPETLPQHAGLRCAERRGTWW